MAWKFKVSKYKNAAPRFPKKEELLQDLPVGNTSYSYGNHIKASCVYMVFNTDSTSGGSLGYLPLNARGRIGNQLSHIHAHGDFVADFDFSPFDDYMLATGSQDKSLKVWLLPKEEDKATISDACLVLPTQDHRIENVLWNPLAEGVLAVSVDKCVKLFDVASATEKIAWHEHGDQVQSLSWSGSGDMLVTTCKDKKMRILDLRSSTVVQEAPGHQNVKDTRVLWLGNSDHILSTGFNSTQEREIKAWDCRSLNSPLTSLGAQGSTGALMCFFDEDTKMVFLAGKSDCSLRFLEVLDKPPYLTEGLVDRTEQIKGAALVPKRAMDVMSGEVNRLLLLVKQSIVSVPYIVPRKSYRDFHDDLYPDTADGEPALTASQWFSGQNGHLKKVKIVPSKSLIKNERRGAILGLNLENKSDVDNNETMKSAPISDKLLQPVPITTKPVPITSKPVPITSKPVPITSKPTIHSSESAETQKEAHTTSNSTPQTVQEPVSDNTRANPPAEPAHPSRVFKVVRQSKYRYITGAVLHSSHHITNVKNLCKTIPGESDLFVSNVHRCAVPLEGAGGIIAVLELSQPGRLGETTDELPIIQNGSKVADLVWDPFDDTRLVVASDNTRINVWRIPTHGLPAGEPQTDPEFYLLGHLEKIYFVRFHPLVKDILMSASYDMTVRMWNLNTRSEVMQLQGHHDQVFCLGWSPCGRLCATVCKDGQIRVFEPRKQTHAIKAGTGPEGSRGARVVWVLDGRYLVVSGFAKTSDRQLTIYNADTLEKLNSVDFEPSPSILIPFYDADSSTIYLFSRGNRIVYNYDVSEEPPHLFLNTSINLTTLHQGLAFLPRKSLDVVSVEVARAWRLTNNSIEPVSFTVPRVKTDYFQDDLYPDTPITWNPSLTAEMWLAGEEPKPHLVSLRPAAMKKLSEAPLEEPKARKFDSFNPDTYKTDEQKKEELMTAIVGKLELSSEPLPQDLTEGVEDEEWDD